MARKTKDGYLHLRAKIYRSGIYEYSAGDLRRFGVRLKDSVPDNAILRIWRDPKEVFSDSVMKSFEHLPMTLQHPGQSVSSRTVNDVITGVTKSPVSRVGDDAEVGVVIMAKDAVTFYESGNKQLSCGYSSKLMIGTMRTPAGQIVDGKQTEIEGNHVAQCMAGRAGTAELGDNIADRENQMTEKKENAVVDAVEFGQMKQQLADAKTEIDTVTKERDQLKGKVSALESAALTDDQLNEKVNAGIADAIAKGAERTKIIERAKQFAPKMEVKDSDTVRQIMEVAIRAQDSKIPLDGQSDDVVKGAFMGLRGGAQVSDSKQNKSSGHFVSDQMPSMADINRLTV